MTKQANKAGTLVRETAKQRKANAQIGKSASKAKANPDLIATSIHDRSGGHVVVTSQTGVTVTFPRYADDATRRTLSAVGGSIKALQADLKARPPVKPQARLATGVDSHNSPHSAKAVRDDRQAATSAKAPKAAKTTAPKAAKNKAPSKGADRDYTAGKAEVTAKADTWRGYMLGTIRKHSNTAKAKAAHEKSGKFSSNKLDFNWAAAQGYITFSK